MILLKTSNNGIKKAFIDVFEHRIDKIGSLS